MTSDKFHFEQSANEQSAQGTQSSATLDQEHLLGQQRAEQEAPQRVLSQYGAHLELIRQMQKNGFVYGNEDIGVFGVHRHGPNVSARLDNLPMWVECLASFDVPAIEKHGFEADDIFFRGLAFRMMWVLYWDFKNERISWVYEGGVENWMTPQPHHLALLKTFNRVNAEMQDRREILENGRGVLYSSPGGARVLWAFADFTFFDFTFSNFEMTFKNSLCYEDLVSGERCDASTLHAVRHHVYLIK